MNNKLLMGILGEKSSDIQDWEKAISIWEEDNDEENFIIYILDVPIGWIGINGLASKEKVIWIKILVILPKYWDKGYGTFTIKNIKRYYSSKGYKKIKLWTDKDNIRAQNCYKNNGFKAIKKEKNKVGSSQEVRERLLFEVLL